MAQPSQGCPVLNRYPWHVRTFVLWRREKCYSAHGTTCTAAGGQANSLPLISTTSTVSTTATSSTTLSGRRRWSGTEPDRTASANWTLTATPGLPAIQRASELPPRWWDRHPNTADSCRRKSFRARTDLSSCASKPPAKVLDLASSATRSNTSSPKSITKLIFNPFIRNFCFSTFVIRQSPSILA